MDALGVVQAAAPASAAVIPRSSPGRQCLTWTRVPVTNQFAPPPRSGAASVVVNGKLYVFGGYGGGTGRLDDFYSFDFESGTWEEVQVLSKEKPGCRENNGVVISDSERKIFLFGGYNGNSWLNDLWEFDIESKRWTCIQESSDPALDADEANSAVVASGDRPAAGNQVRGKAPSRRFGYVSVVHGGKFVLWGGFDGSRWLNDMYVFDFVTKTWMEIQASGSLPSVRSCPAWAKDDTHVYIQGGYDGMERKADFFACDLATYTWTEMPCLGTPPSPRYFHSCCLYGNKMYLYGGYSGTERLADMHAYDFETNHWSQVDCTGGDAPSGRSSLVAQVYENNLWVFGGYNGQSVLNDFYKFRLKPIGVPPPALVSDLRRLINNVELADVRFAVEGKEVFAHRAILAVRSEYFRVMLSTGGMRESILNSEPGGGMPGMNGTPIVLRDVSYNVFVKVLEFLYTDTVKDVSLETAIHLMIASEQFMLDRMKALCEDLIRRDIHVETVTGILVASHRHHATGLKEIALEYILRNLNDPVVMSGLSELKAEPDLLLEIIKRNTEAQTRQPGPGAVHENVGGPFGGAGAEWNDRR
jgi:N-acetylneuraminic acid mutarotase